MQIRLATKNDEIKWNQFIAAQAMATPYHHYGWKKAVEQAYGHSCYYFIAEEDDGKISGILPTVEIKPPLIPGKLCSLPFCDLGGCITTDKETETALIHKAMQLMSEKKMRTFEYRSTEQYMPDKQQANNEESHKDQKVRMLLELPETSEMLMAGFKSKLRSQIRKAEKNNLRFVLGNTESFVDKFYNVISQNMRLLGSPVHSKNWYEEIAKAYGSNLIISIVSLEDKVAGAGLVLLNGTRATIPWASTISEYNRLAPNMLVYWSLLEHVTDRGCDQFDFGRSSYGEGTYRFKQQWGAQPVPLIWKTFQNSAQNDLSETDANTSKKSSIRSIIETIWRKLPLVATTAIGPKLRKYISL